MPAPPAAHRCNADYRWTVKKVTAFLRALAACGVVAQAAREVGMSRKAAYALKARLANPRFQDMWALAVRTGRAARAEARAAQARAQSPWGPAGLAGFAHLRRSAAAVQGDTFSRQGDTLGRKVTF